MSEQQAQGADEAIDLNNELKTRREKLAALREQGVVVISVGHHDAGKALQLGALRQFFADDEATGLAAAQVLHKLRPRDEADAASCGTF